MRNLLSALLYTALTVAANAADLDGLKDGDMKKLVVHAEPQEVSTSVFTTPDGAEKSLADWQGQWVVLNFWATWCAPCREEMPSLDALNAEFGGESFAVVPVATGRNALPAIRKLFDETGVQTLPVLLDPKQKLAREMAVLGLPITVILNPEGQEIARLRGDADWHSDSARAIVQALLAGS